MFKKRVRQTVAISLSEYKCLLYSILLLMLSGWIPLRRYFSVRKGVSSMAPLLEEINQVWAKGLSSRDLVILETSSKVIKENGINVLILEELR